jgi:hypothetical protein
MQRTALLVLGIWLLGAGLAEAQGIPEGTFASSKEGCTKLQGKTAAQLGEDLDFVVLTKKGLTGYEQMCDFVNVIARNATSWVATAFCDEAGYTYPDLVAIAQKADGTLRVTRMTDLTQQGASGTDDSSDATDDQETSGDQTTAKLPSASGATDEGAATDQQAGDDTLNAYVPCQNVKQ